MKSYKIFLGDEFKESLEKVVTNELPNNSINLDEFKHYGKNAHLIKGYLSFCSMENDLHFVKESTSILIDFRKMIINFLLTNSIITIIM